MPMASEQRFSKVRQMLESAGYELDRIKGSHHVFTKAQRQPVSIPVHRGKVKPYYVRQAEKIIEEESGASGEQGD